MYSNKQKTMLTINFIEPMPSGKEFVLSLVLEPSSSYRHIVFNNTATFLPYSIIFNSIFIDKDSPDEYHDAMRVLNFITHDLSKYYRIVNETCTLLPTTDEIELLDDIEGELSYACAIFECYTKYVVTNKNHYIIA